MKKIVRTNIVVKPMPHGDIKQYQLYIGNFLICTHVNKEAAKSCADKLQKEIEKELKK